MEWAFPLLVAPVAVFGQGKALLRDTMCRTLTAGKPPPRTFLLTLFSQGKCAARTNRKFFPNVQNKFFWSHMLGRWFRINVTTHALRCIERVGGLDEFLLYSKPRLLEESDFALKTRKTLIDMWEKENNRKFNRSKIIYEARLKQLDLDRKLEAKRWKDIQKRTAWEPDQYEVVTSQLDYPAN